MDSIGHIGCWPQAHRGKGVEWLRPLLTNLHKKYSPSSMMMMMMGERDFTCRS